MTRNEWIQRSLLDACTVSSRGTVEDAIGRIVAVADALEKSGAAPWDVDKTEEVVLGKRFRETLVRAMHFAKIVQYDDANTADAQVLSQLVVELYAQVYEQKNVNI